MTVFEKVKKKICNKVFEDERVQELDLQLKTINEAFEKSELIRREQKLMIGKLKRQLERERDQHGEDKKKDLNEEDLDDKPVKQNTKSKKRIEDKENYSESQTARARQQKTKR